MDTSQILAFVASFVIGMFGAYTLLDMIDNKYRILTMKPSKGSMKR